MNEKNQVKKTFFKTAFIYLKDNLKVLIVLFAIIFVIFISYQVYSYYKINKINSLSISFFENKDLNDELTKFSEMNKIKNEKSFYSILSMLELIKNHIDKDEYEKSIAIYNKLLFSKDLDNNYISLLAIKAAYLFIDIVIEQKNDKYISDIKNFISFIDESLDNYLGYKNELLYLVSILSLDDNSTYKNNSELLTLYENIMNNQKISFSIKERVKKIHEFYIFN